MRRTARSARVSRQSVSNDYAETYLESSVPTDDDNFRIPRYSSVRDDHPPCKKGGAVLVYYKDYLPLKLIDVKYLHESISYLHKYMS